MYKLTFALALATCSFADPIPVTGSGVNFTDLSDGLIGGILSFSGTKGIDSIQVTTNNTCGFVTARFVGGICQQASATFDGVNYSNVFASDIIVYTLGDGGTVSLTSHSSGITIMVPIRGYFNEGPFIKDTSPGEGQANILISSVPEPASLTLSVAGLIGLLRLGRHRYEKRRPIS
jgi:hypothetical protein